MNALLEQARNLLAEVRRNQIAHQVSYEHHYVRDLWIEGTAKVVSAIVGAGVFTVLVSQLGLDGKRPLSVSVPAQARWLYWLVLLLCIIAPALTAVGVVRHDGKDAEEHLRSMDRYVEVKDQLEDFLHDYADLDSTGGLTDANRREAEESYKKIREKARSAGSIGLMPRARAKAGIRLRDGSA